MHNDCHYNHIGNKVQFIQYRDLLHKFKRLLPIVIKMSSSCV